MSRRKKTATCGRLGRALDGLSPAQQQLVRIGYSVGISVSSSETREQPADVIDLLPRLALQAARNRERAGG